MHYYQYRQLAAAYGQGDYGSDAYNAQSTSGTGGSTTTGANSGGSSVLTNTGFDIALIVVIACVVVFVALIVRFWKRPAKKPVQPTPSETSEDL